MMLSEISEASFTTKIKNKVYESDIVHNIIIMDNNNKKYYNFLC